VLFRALPDKFKLSGSEKDAIRVFARTLSDRVTTRRPFTCVISHDRELRRLNRIFRRRDYTTDVLSFPAAPDAAQAELGEIVISTERATAQARDFGHERIQEMRILMLHGILHLSGMDHERDNGEMARLEAHWRAKLGLPETLILRAETRRAKTRMQHA